MYIYICIYIYIYILFSCMQKFSGQDMAVDCNNRERPCIVGSWDSMLQGSALTSEDSAPKP